jgi:hypothetical protein
MVQAMHHLLLAFYGWLIYAFFSEARIAFCVVPQTEQVPLRAGLPFFIVTRWGSFISVFFLHLTQKYRSATVVASLHVLTTLEEIHVPGVGGNRTRKI